MNLEKICFDRWASSVRTNVFAFFVLLWIWFRVSHVSSFIVSIRVEYGHARVLYVQNVHTVPIRCFVSFQSVMKGRPLVLSVPTRCMCSCLYKFVTTSSLTSLLNSHCVHNVAFMSSPVQESPDRTQWNGFAMPTSFLTFSITKSQSRTSRSSSISSAKFARCSWWSTKPHNQKSMSFENCVRNLASWWMIFSHALKIQRKNICTIWNTLVGFSKNGAILVQALQSLSNAKMLSPSLSNSIQFFTALEDLARAPRRFWSACWKTHCQKFAHLWKLRERALENIFAPFVESLDAALLMKNVPKLGADSKTDKSTRCCLNYSFLARSHLPLLQLICRLMKLACPSRRSSLGSLGCFGSDKRKLNMSE